MEAQRRGQIALELLKDKARREGILLGRDRRRDMSNRVKATGVPLSELREFGELLIEDLLNETFGEQ